MSGGITYDPKDPRLTHGADEEPAGQAEVYLVLTPDERGKGYVRPLRYTYTHLVCQQNTTMNLAIAETFARDPSFYGGTFCAQCQKHRPLAEFVWAGTTEQVGS